MRRPEEQHRLPGEGLTLSIRLKPQASWQGLLVSLVRVQARRWSISPLSVCQRAREVLGKDRVQELCSPGPCVRDMVHMAHRQGDGRYCAAEFS